MKDYIDLTQLPPAEINRMVEELNHNNVEGLRRFFERLGLLYGLPLDQVVNVFSDYLMFDKHNLRCAFEHFSHKHAVEMLSLLLGMLSVETTPLSVVEDLSEDVYLSIDSILDELSATSLSFDDLSGEIQARIEELVQNVDDKIGQIELSSDLFGISSVIFNGTEISAENRVVELSAATQEDLNKLSDYFTAYANGIKDAVSKDVNDQISALSALKADKVDVQSKYNALNNKIYAAQMKINLAVKELVEKNYEMLLSVGVPSLSARIDELSKYIQENTNLILSSIADSQYKIKQRFNELVRLVPSDLSQDAELSDVTSSLNTLFDAIRTLSSDLNVDSEANNEVEQDGE